MPGLGTAINAAAIAAGTAVGLLVGGRLPERVRATLLSGVGLVVLAFGVGDALVTENAIFPLVAVVLGGIVGELLGIEERLAWVGEAIRRRVERRVDPEAEGGALAVALPESGSAPAGRHRFVEGFVAASVLYVVGPLAILGAIDDGLTGSVELLAVKAALDGLVSIVFAAQLGVGVGFSVIPVVLYQGAITLAASGLDEVLSERMITELTATGGLLVMGIGLRLLDIKQVRVASFLPGLLLAPLLVAVFAR